MKVIIVSGRSGSGKTTALHILEDLGFYCVDNLPVALIPALTKQIRDDALSSLGRQEESQDIAIGVDARNAPRQLAAFQTIQQELQDDSIQLQILYLDADDKTLLKRISDTRRKHPSSEGKRSWADAITRERKILEPIAIAGDLTKETSN